jgi:hypothetical protein
MLTPTFRREDYLPEFLSNYAKGQIPSLKKIILLWVEADHTPPKWLTDSFHIYSIPVEMRLMSTMSLNERFRDGSDITTSCVFSLDDDILLQPADVEAAYQAWKQIGQRQRMIGFSERRVTNALKYSTRRGEAYQWVD